MTNYFKINVFVVYNMFDVPEGQKNWNGKIGERHSTTYLVLEALLKS